MTQWKMQADDIKTNNRIKVCFCLTKLSRMKMVTWEFHVGDSAKNRYNMILGRDLLREF